MLTRRSFAASAAALPVLACGGADSDAGAAPTGLTWREAPQAPFAVQEIYPTLHDGGIWIAGGFAPLAALGATRRVIVFELARNAWREGPELPEPAHHIQLVSLSDQLWAIGGFLAGDNRRRWICTPRVLRLDGEQWVEGPALPKPIAEAVSMVHAGRIHLIGGRSPAAAANAAWNDQTDVSDHFVLTPGASAWERAAPLPLARNSAAGVSDGERLHVISGRTVAGGQTSRHDIYDPATDTWSEGPAFPEPRGGLAGAFFRGHIVAGGGEIFDLPSVGDTLYAFENGAWSVFATMPISRHSHGFVAAGDALYALGGAQRVSGDGTLARLDVLD